ncbi:putative zinc-binding metallopeptidase [Asticcacaulis sp. EMRT-3]|uniref:zinc-binding metallopeptidase family protein n=1 Tax=Asticcacaulis sp. EMRT-3 TaxID=3040349 RepID=UPI0024AF9152|nr:putative zinc-binding metallopeptidase [Asticcacaulis sp. EMRT-3]MDI7775168.1 putative zinc-binding metallopeptidase [Asticcacaulis sp. EMRT-3]
MRLFRCDHCGNPIHFDNRVCLNCGFRLGFVPEALGLYAVTADPRVAERWRRVDEPQFVYRFCANAAWDICNWLVPEDEPENFCQACRHNGLVPDPNTELGLKRWRRIAEAQRHLFYSFLRWNLPHPTRREDPQGGLLFDLKNDEITPDGACKPAVIGHDEGHIVIRNAEADDLTREQQRELMNEPYRTLLGHFRHETGHFIWNKLVRDQNKLDSFRAIFGDERDDYAEALERHYHEGPPPGWGDHYISFYATTHPWEDFAECFAHVLHIVDSLETAHIYGIALAPMAHTELAAQAGFDPYTVLDFDRIAEVWIPLSLALNSIHHSMGERDLYPFILTPAIQAKLKYVHSLITRQV